jgi:hypothetical protein
MTVAYIIVAALVVVAIGETCKVAFEMLTRPL